MDLIIFLFDYQNQKQVKTITKYRGGIGLCVCVRAYLPVTAKVGEVKANLLKSDALKLWGNRQHLNGKFHMKEKTALDHLHYQQIESNIPVYSLLFYHSCPLTTTSWVKPIVK